MSLEEGYGIIEHVAAFSILLPILLGLLKIKVLNHVVRTLILYLSLCFAVDRLTLNLLPDIKKVNILLNCFTVMEFSFISLLYYFQYRDLFLKRILLWVFFGFLLFAGYIFLVKGSYAEEDNIVRTTGSAIIIVFSCAFLYQVLFDNNIINLTQHYFYWFNLTFLLYFSSVILLFMNTDFLEHCKPETAYLLWGLHQVLNILTNLLIFLGIWVQKEK